MSRIFYNLISNAIKYSDDGGKIEIKAVKNKTEIKNMINTHILDGVALTKFIYWIKNINKKQIN